MEVRERRDLPPEAMEQRQVGKQPDEADEHERRAVEDLGRCG